MDNQTNENEIFIHSFLPETAEKIVAQLNTTLRDFDDLDQFVKHSRRKRGLKP